MLAGSISGAAERLNIAQPTVTNTIRRFEDVLGVTLFDRSSPRLKPSSTAHQIFEIVGPSITAFERLEQSIFGVVKGQDSRFRLGVSPSVSMRLGPRALAHFWAERPGTLFRMDTLSMQQNRDYIWMSEGDCTVTIFEVEEPGISSFQIGSVGTVCVLPEDHPLAIHEDLRVEEIAHERLVFFHPNTPHGKLVRRVFAQTGIEPNIAIETRFAETAVPLMREGFGIGLLDGLTGLSVKDADLRVLTLRNAPRLPVQLHCRSDKVDAPEIALAVSCLRKAAKELGLEDTGSVADRGGILR